MAELFQICVDILKWIAQVVGITYEEANIWIFVIIHPLLTVILLAKIIALKTKQEEPEKERPTYLLKTLCYGNEEYFHYEDEAELEIHISALHDGDRGLAYLYTDNRVVVNSIARDGAVQSYDVMSTEKILKLVKDYTG